MSLRDDFRSKIEQEEADTVSNAFGGSKAKGKTKSFSVAKLRDWLLAQNFNEQSDFANTLDRGAKLLPKDLFVLSVGNLIRFSFLIELTNLTVGSTKMKTRWLSGLILMPQDNSFEPIQGEFIPGNDPRASSFDDCLHIFSKCLNIICDQFEAETDIVDVLLLFNKNKSIPYEFPFDYVNPSLVPIHVASNVEWALNFDITWLLEVRPIFKKVLDKQQINKIQTKTYKTDRALTGKDKTNRAKRWEVLSEDFQHASLKQCWSVEKKLLSELIGFNGFPTETIKELQDKGLISNDIAISRCPVTLEVLEFSTLMADAQHGVSDYQVGHLHPLKRNGLHEEENICWQSSDGNRIQGDMMIEEILELLETIKNRKNELDN